MSQRRGGGAPGRVRIIGGAWRRRWLPVAALPGLRPSPDAQRETLFNWLQSRVAGASVLDLFAGTGALGLEAASRGARAVLLVERNPVAVDQLRANVALLGARQVTVQRADAQWLLEQGRGATMGPFDLVFLDPPFREGRVAPALAALLVGGWLAPEAYVYVEQEAGLVPPPDWEVLRERVCGQAHGLLLRQPSGR